MEFEEDKYSNLTYAIIGSIIGSLIVYFIFIKPSGGQQVVSENKQSSQISQTMVATPYQNQLYQNQLYQNQLQNQQSVMYNQDPLINSQYKNAEVWEVERSPDGFISKVKADRDAKVGTTI